ncbi:g10971 [Coccomyxa viridis]|uniref:G10971 protein n=1 Tax=Coccomyxa viridis TaxID=1274662 RepID=A0ABP1G6P4_9CHLO
MEDFESPRPARTKSDDERSIMEAGRLGSSDSSSDGDEPASQVYNFAAFSADVQKASETTTPHRHEIHAYSRAVGLANPKAIQREEDSAAATAEAAQAREVPGKYKHQSLQTPTAVEVHILANNLVPERVAVAIEAQRLRVVIKDADGQIDHELDIALYGLVDVAESEHEVLESRIEIRLRKAQPISWPTLEKSEQKAAANSSALTMGHPRSYPSSRSKSHWDKTKVKKEEGMKRLDGEQALQKLSRDDHPGSEENTRRAMNKFSQAPAGERAGWAAPESWTTGADQGKQRRHSPVEQQHELWEHDSSDESGQTQREEDSAAATAEAAQAREVPGKYKHQSLQTPTAVEVHILANNLVPERVAVAIEAQRLRVVIKDADGQIDHELDIALYGLVDVAESEHEVLESRIEIRLRKAQPISWPTLEKSEQKAAANSSALTMGHPRSDPKEWFADMVEEEFFHRQPLLTDRYDPMLGPELDGPQTPSKKVVWDKVKRLLCMAYGLRWLGLKKLRWESALQFWLVLFFGIAGIVVKAKTEAWISTLVVGILGLVMALFVEWKKHWK